MFYRTGQSIHVSYTHGTFPTLYKGQEYRIKATPSYHAKLDQTAFVSTFFFKVCKAPEQTEQIYLHIIAV